MARKRRKTARIREREELKEVERYKSNFSWVMENYGARKEAREAGFIDLTPPPPNDAFKRMRSRMEERQGHKLPIFDTDELLDDEEFTPGFVGRAEGWER